MDKIRINLYDLLICISSAQELISNKLSNHHQQVAYLAYRMSEQIGLPIEQQKDIFIAALIHDIGALSSKEMLELIESEPITVNNHAFRGAKLIECFKPLQNYSNIIKYHHIPWKNGLGKNYMGDMVPFESHIIHLADRICSLIKPSSDILSQLEDIQIIIKKQSDDNFESSLINEICKFCRKEYIWLDLISQCPTKTIFKTGLLDTLILEIDDIVDLALLYSHIIDFRSRFTACHSVGVANTAAILSRIIGFSSYESKMMLIAGYLHDLGKIAIDENILEKPSHLDDNETKIMKSHTYYTYRLLEPMEPLHIINTWASFHHEKIDGSGYPFHILGDNLSLGSRIMAVADVFTAITENRPYRKGMSYDSTVKILKNMVINNSLDKNIVNILIDNYQDINEIRMLTQDVATKKYDELYS